MRVSVQKQHRVRSIRLSLAMAMFAMSALLAQAPDNVERIKAEAQERSAVMQHALMLTEVYGPRLTGSRNFNEAIDWAARRLREFGAAKVHTETFPWGIDWSYKHISLDLVAPQRASLVAYPATWSAGTRGRVSGEAYRPRAEIERFEASAFQEVADEIAGRVRGKFVLLHSARTPPALAGPASRRFTDEELAALQMPVPLAPPPTSAPASPDLNALLRQLLSTLKAEGALGVIWRGSGGSGVVPVSTISTAYRNPATPAPLPIVYVALEQYNRLVRLLEQGPVRLALDLAVDRGNGLVDGKSLFADIVGESDARDIVMLGAHLDSWPAATGATDNAAGSAVVMEAARILLTLKLKMHRTVRIALWGGEEGASAGARTYIEQHFSPAGANRRNDGERLAAYFNLDAGTGKIRGIYSASHREFEPFFRRWLEPFAAVGATAISPRRPSGAIASDDGAFHEAGLPGFAFIQDPLDYDRTRHTNIDMYDRLQPADLKQAAAVMAAFAYFAATTPDLPRGTGTTAVGFRNP